MSLKIDSFYQKKKSEEEQKEKAQNEEEKKKEETIEYFYIYTFKSIGFKQSIVMEIVIVKNRIAFSILLCIDLQVIVMIICV